MDEEDILMQKAKVHGKERHEKVLSMDQQLKPQLIKFPSHALSLVRKYAGFQIAIRQAESRNFRSSPHRTKPFLRTLASFSFNVPQHSKRKDDPMQWSNGLAVLFEASKSNEHYRVRGFGYAVIGGKAS
jgi:hypothetical protein